MSTSEAPVGRLIVCPTPIGNLDDVTLRVLDALRSASVIACEDTRHTRVLLARHGISARLISLHEHNERARTPELLARVAAGERVALVSDAGTPGVSDPGFALLRACREAGLAVEVLPGPSAVTTALVASGLPSERWCFVGFLPRARRELESLLAGASETLVAFESPRRLAATLALLAAGDPQRPVAVCRELTKLHEEVRRAGAARARGPLRRAAGTGGGRGRDRGERSRCAGACGRARGAAGDRRGGREAAARRHRHRAGSPAWPPTSSTASSRGNSSLGAPMSFYVTTPIYYVNAAPHLGHAYTTIAADVMARHHRQRGESVFFLTGTDEHGEPVADAAHALGIEPQELADRNAERFKALAPRLGASNDFFIRTTDPQHEAVVQSVLSRVRENGFVYEGTYEGWYCPRCADFKAENEIDEGNRCPIHHIELTRESEENYFFKLSAFQERLEQLYVEHEDFVAPRSRYNESLSFIRSGLRDVPLTRHKLTWGVPVPWDPEHVFYVWFDALLNYYSALSYASRGGPRRRSSGRPTTT